MDTIKQLLSTVKGMSIHVSQLPKDESIRFYSDSQDVDFVRVYIGISNPYEESQDDSDSTFNVLSPFMHDSYFVLVGNAEILQIWGMIGIIPDDNNTITRIY